jgi:erythromycin esterase
MRTKQKRTKLAFIKKSILVALCLSTIIMPFLSYAQSVSSKTDIDLNSQAFISWAKENALALQNTDSAKGTADLQPLKKIVGGAKIVALGEPAHGLHETVAFRNRLFRFLVENCGFTTLVLEAGLAESRLAADFVANGTGTAEAAARKLTIGKPAPETMALMEWMRSYNANPAHHVKLRIYGMDMQLIGFPGDTTPSHAALDQALAYLNRIDPLSGKEMTMAFSPYLNRLSVANYPLLSPQEHDKLSILLDTLIALFERQRIKFINSNSKDEYEWGYRNAIVARQTDRMVRVTPQDQPGKIPPEAWKSVNSRDEAMAENVAWILNSQHDGGKIMVYAHNAHVKNAPTAGGVWDTFAQQPNSTGQYLRSMFGDDLFIVGMSCNPSAKTAQPGSLDIALLNINKPRFFLYLKTASGNAAAAKWLAIRRPMEANAVSYLTLSVSTAFDAVVLLNKETLVK